ncbi:MAG: hypothetical protein AUG44_01050 [Actinobacteria bacterium 13_1_20CM_3_71_11]|nr:MAG: hypothetical protein AUG44_01050 [Actinobacteria bacterium 13_1_20CM_3_71_11]TML27441.1 MAG: hypothetical protein E6G35_09500 [Actinomycetota bacterium]
MLDDMPALRDAFEAYRGAAIAAGVAWPDPPDADGGPPPPLVYRLFDVDHVAEQLIWLRSQGWDPSPVLPEGGGILPWPTDAQESLDSLSFSFATPFPWRHQLPLFHFGDMVYTFVLAGDREGEIWRYEFRPDTWDSMRAATSLAALFTQWTKAIGAGVVRYGRYVHWLQVAGDVQDPFDALLVRSPDLDPFAFPISVPYAHEPLLRERQCECGVDMDSIYRPECHKELLDAIDATLASLGR